MAQHDMNIANQGFPATRADLNNALQALVSNSSGTSAPSTTFANQWWYDTTNNKMYLRNEANSAWIEVFALDQSNNEWQIVTGQISAADGDGLVFKTDDGNTRITLSDGGDVTFADGTDVITASAGTDNVRIGEGAGDSIASGGNENILIGKNAGTALTTGDRNVAVGHTAFDSATDQQDNVAVGHNALSSITSSGPTDTNCTAIGSKALESLTTGYHNTAVGYGSQDAMVSGIRNVSMGRDSLGSDTNGSYSTAIGDLALSTQNYGSATDSYNVAVGRAAGRNVTTGTGNTYIGSLVGDANTDGTANVAMGGDGTYAALGSDTRGKFTTAIGFGALYSQNFTSSTASNNVALGYFAGGLTSTGTNNTYIGYGAGDDCTDGIGNTVVGSSALSADADDRNTAIGYNALQVTTGEQNSAVGADSLVGCTSGINNTAMGYAAIGLATVTGNYNSAFGFAAGGNITSGSNNICIGNGAGRSGTPGGLINTGSNRIALGNDSITSFHCKTSLTATSDERDKTDFEDLDLGLDFVKELKPVTYVWDSRIQYVDQTQEDWEENLDLDTVESDGSKKGDDLQVGFKAQDVIALEDAAGHRISDKTNLLATVTNDGKQYGLMYERFIPILTKAIQELSAKNDALEAQNTTQATQIADLITRVEALEAE